MKIGVQNGEILFLSICVVVVVGRSVVAVPFFLSIFLSNPIPEDFRPRFARKNGHRIFHNKKWPNFLTLKRDSKMIIKHFRIFYTKKWPKLFQFFVEVVDLKNYIKSCFFSDISVIKKCNMTSRTCSRQSF